MCLLMGQRKSTQLFNNFEIQRAGENKLLLGGHPLPAGLFDRYAKLSLFVGAAPRQEKCRMLSNALVQMNHMRGRAQAVVDLQGE